MIKLLKPFTGALMALALLAGHASSQEAGPQRDVTPKDVTELEAFGRAAISPDGRWAVYEKRGPYDTVSRFDLGERSLWTIMDLWLVDLAAPSPTPVRLLPNEGPGLLRVGWSPDSRRLLIARRQGDLYEYGVVTMADRTVRWTGLTPEFSRTGAAAEWLSADTVALSVRPDHSLPEIVRYYGGAQSRMLENWRRSAEGDEPSREVVDTRDGRVAPETPTPAGALVLLDVRDGGVRILANGTIEDFSASPDRRRIAVVRSGDPTPLTGPLVQLERTNRARLSLIDLDDGEITDPLPGWDLARTLLRWSPTSRALLVWAREDGRTWDDGRLLQVEADRVVETPLEGLTPGDAVQTSANVGADWIGETPVLYARAPDGTRYDWHLLAPGQPPVNLTRSMPAASSRIQNVSRSSLHMVADGSLWRIGEAGAERLTDRSDAVEAATPSDKELTRRPGYNEAPRRDWTALTRSDGGSLVYSAGSGVTRLGGEKAVTRILATSDANAMVLERIGHEETLWLRRRGGSERIDAVNSGKRDVRFIEPVPLRHVGVNGSEVTDWILLPPDRTPGKIRGLIVEVYPGQSGPDGWYGPDSQAYGVRTNVLAAAGFAVLSPTAPGGTPVAERGDEYVRVVDLAVDAALAAYPELPADRIGIYGHSFGGYMTMEIAVRSHRYQSYVASSGVYDMIGLWGERDPSMRAQPEEVNAYHLAQTYVENGQGGLGAPPWEAPEAYLSSSPFLRAGEVTAPVMLMTADMDFLPMSQTEIMFGALYRQGKTARMVTYWGEHHSPYSPANIVDRYRQIFDWFDRTLVGDPAIIGSASAASPSTAPMTPAPPP